MCVSSDCLHRLTGLRARFGEFKFVEQRVLSAVSCVENMFPAALERGMSDAFKASTSVLSAVASSLPHSRPSSGINDGFRRSAVT